MLAASVRPSLDTRRPAARAMGADVKGHDLPRPSCSPPQSALALAMVGAVAVWDVVVEAWDVL